jgi:hypothetical protein
MNHTKVKCSSCNKELHIKVAAGFKAPDACMCKACYNSESTQKQLPVNLSAAQSNGKFWKLDRAIKGSA